MFIYGDDSLHYTIMCHIYDTKTCSVKLNNSLINFSTMFSLLFLFIDNPDAC